MKPFTNFKTLIVLLSLFVIGSVQFAQTETNDTSQTVSQDEEKKQAVISSYEVQPGDTLSSLSKEYLGDASLWQLNANINPELPDLNNIKPGTIIQLITGYVKTQANSSAVLIFVEDTGSESKVQISEHSRLFITSEKQDQGITRNEIEVEKGQVELKIDTAKVTNLDELNEFEIILGEVKTTPTVDANGQISTKARLADNDASQIMVYSGNSAVESGGISVDVETGMGTIAKSGEAPSPPEKLLEAPTIEDSNPTETNIDSSVTVHWKALEGAATYKLLLCNDSNCNQIFRTISDLTENSSSLTNLPLGSIHWKVSGISASGLDGFASSSQAILVSEAPPPEPEPTIPWYFWLAVFLYGVCFLYTFYVFLNIKSY